MADQVQTLTGMAIVCRRVTKSFGAGEDQARVLRGVDLDVPYGGMLMLAGPSGCGKTTLLSVMAGLLNADSGSVIVLGESTSRMPAGEAVRFRRRNIGFVFQQYNLLPALTAAENAAVPLLAAGVARKKAVAAAAELLGYLGLRERLDAFPAQLSGGQQQRVALARALVHDPRLVVCDEPTSALDHDAGNSVMELLTSVAVRPGRAVLVVTHDHRLFRFADRVAQMDDGQILEPTDAVRTRPMLAGVN